MADGSITFSTKLDNKDLEKDLAKTKKEIQKTEETITAQEAKKSPLVKQAAELEQKMRAARAEVKRCGQDWAAGVAGADKNQSAAQERLKGIQTEYQKVTEQIDKIDAKLLPAYEKLDGMKEKAGGLQQQIAKASSATSRMKEATALAEKQMEKFTKRVKALAKRVFVFTIITMALRELRTWLWSAIKTNDEAVDAVARLKGALLTLAQPMVEVITPAFTAFVQILSSAISVMARFVAAIFGTTAEDAASAAEELYNEQAALEGVGDAAKAATKALAPFDEINRLTGDTANTAVDSILPNFSAIGLAELPMWLKNLTFDLEAKIGELRFSWDEGMLLENKDAWIIALTGLLGAVIGGMFGGLHGAIIGLLLGMTIGLVLSSFTDKMRDPSQAKDQFIVVLTAILGAVLGSMFGGLPGAAIGLILGLAVSIAWIEFKEGSFGGWDKDGTFTTVLMSILGAILGAKFGGLPGAAIGLLLGLLVSLIGIEFKKGEASNWDSQDTLTTVLSAILGAILGAAFGGLPGAAIGLLLGAVISFVSIDFAEGNYNKSEAIASLRVAIFAILGAVLGTMFGGFVGGVVGLLIGMTIGFASVGFDEKLEQSVRTAAQKALKVALSTIIGALIGAVFGGGVFGGIIGGAIGLTFGLAVTFSDVEVKGKTTIGDLIESAGKGIASGVWGTSYTFKAPGLATGSVIPPNREFLAVLGDNKTETEVVSPLSTMKQAMIEAMRESGGTGNGTITVVVNLDGKEVARNQVKHINDMTRQAGKPVLLF